MVTAVETAVEKDEMLCRFVEQIVIAEGTRGPLTVNDLKVGIRRERLSELTDWPNHKLDPIELHLAQFAGEEPFDSVFEVLFERYPEKKGRSVSGLCAPSPYAWT